MTDVWNILIGHPIYSDADGPTAAPVLSGGDWVSDRPIQRLQDGRLHKVARSTSLDLQDTRFSVDLDASRAVGLIAVMPGRTTNLRLPQLSSTARIRALGRPAGMLFCLEAGDDIADAGGTFTRATTATYVDRNGVLRTAGVGVVRDGHFIGGKRTILREDARTNGCVWSEDLANASWIKTALTVSANTFTAPDGTAGGDGLAEDGTNAEHYVDFPCPATTAAKPQSVSVFVQAYNRSWIHLSSVDKAGVVRRTWFNVLTGVIGTTAVGHSARIERVGTTEWYRCSIVFDSGTGGGTLRVVLGLAVGDGALGYAGSSITGVGVWGGQFEADAPFPSSYIKTLGATVTRNAGILTFVEGNAPQTLTLYIKFIERGTISLLNTTIVAIGQSGLPSGAYLWVHSTGTYYKVQHGNGSTTSDSVLAVAPAVGDTVELRVVLAANGAVTIGQSINGGAEIVAAAGGAAALAGAWGSGAPKVMIGESGIGDVCFAAFESVRAVAGTKTLAQIQALVYDSGWQDVWPDDAETIDRLNISTIFLVPSTYTQLMTSVSIQIDDEDNADGYIDLARLVVAAGYQVPVNASYGAKEGFEHSSSTAESDGGSIIVDQRPLRRSFSGSFPNTDLDDLYTGLRRMMRRAGVSGQFYWVFDPSETDPLRIQEQSYLARFKALTAFDHAIVGRGNQPIEVEEVL